MEDNRNVPGSNGLRGVRASSHGVVRRQSSSILPRLIRSGQLRLAKGEMLGKSKAERLMGKIQVTLKKLPKRSIRQI